METHEVRAYTLLRNVRGKSSASAHGHGLSRPCIHDEGSSCPSTLTNPARIGCRHGLSRPCTFDKGRSCPLTLTNPARVGCATFFTALPALHFPPVG